MDGTSSGPIVAASVEDPGSPEAVFVPFIKADLDKVQKPKKKDNLMKKIVESLSSGADCAPLLSKILLSEGADSAFKEAKELRRVAECKKNKDKFREMLRKKRAAAAKKEEPEVAADDRKAEDRKKEISEAIASAKKAKKLVEGKTAEERVSAALAKLGKKQISERKFDREAELLRSALGRKDESSKEGKTFKFECPIGFIQEIKQIPELKKLNYEGTEDGVMLWVNPDNGDRFEVQGDPDKSDIIDAAIQAILD